MRFTNSNKHKANLNSLCISQYLQQNCEHYTFSVVRKYKSLHSAKKNDQNKILKIIQACYHFSYIIFLRIAKAH